MSFDRAGIFVAGCIAALFAHAAPALAQAQAQPASPGETDSKLKRAKSLPTAALMATAGEFSATLDPVIQAALENFEVVEIVAVPGMDLQALQLALDCVGETNQCLKVAASRMRVQVLIAPTLSRAANEHVLSILRFDATGGGEMKRALRRHAGAQVGGEVLDDVPAMLRELFELPPEEPKAVAQTVAPSTEPVSEAAAPDSYELPPMSEPGFPIGPVVVAGAGVAAIGAGIAVGVVMNGNQAEYERAYERARTRAQVDSAIDTRDAGERQEVIANVLFAVGGAAIVAGGIWLAVDLTSRPEAAPTTAVAPAIGPGIVALTLVHRGESL